MGITRQEQNLSYYIFFLIFYSTTDIEHGEDVNSTTETETSNNTSSGNNISIQTEEPCKHSKISSYLT